MRFDLNRRRMLAGGSVLMTHAAFPSVLAAFASGCAPQGGGFFNAEEMRTLTALVDVILPETDSPAASAAGAHTFITMAVGPCASPEGQTTLREGLRDLDGEARTEHGRRFDEIEPAQQADLLRRRAEADMALDYDVSFFKLVKDYTMTGYFLSEIGATQALAYEQVPGGYWGDLPLQPGQKAWAI